MKDPEKEDDEGFETVEEAQVELIRRSELEFSQKHIDKVQASYRINFVQLEKTEEYKNYVAAERVFLGDEIDVYEETLDIELTVRAMRRKYDVLRERVIEVELSNAVVKKKPPTISDVMNGLDKIENVITENDKWYTDAINNATDLIHNGLKDSYVIVRQNEIIIGDTQDINTMTNVWIWNRGGLGFSRTGYYGEFGTAITMDGSIVASFITTGILNANLIKTGVIRNNNNDFEINLDDGTIKIKNNNFKIVVDGEEQGVVGQSQFAQNNKEFEFKITENTSPNLMPNSSFEKEEVYTRNHPFILDWTKGGDGTYPATIDGGKAILLYTNGGDSYFVKDTAIKIEKNTKYTISFYYCCTHGRLGSNYIFINGNPVNIPITYIGDRAWHRHEFSFITTDNVDGITAIRFGIVAQEACWILFDNVQIEKGERASKYRYKQNEVCNGVSFIDHEGMGVKHEDGSYTKMLSNGFKRYIGSTGYSYHYLTYIGKTQKLDLNPVTIQLPDDFKNKDFKVNLSIEEIANPEGWMVQSFQVFIQAHIYNI